MSESFHQFDSRDAVELFEYFRVKGFSGYRTITQRRDVVFRYIFAYQEPEYRRGRTERCDMVFLDHVENVGRNEFVEVVDKDIGAGDPLAVKFSPYGFSPAGIGEGEV